MVLLCGILQRNNTVHLLYRVRKSFYSVTYALLLSISDTEMKREKKTVFYLKLMSHVMNKEKFLKKLLFEIQ